MLLSELLRKKFRNVFICQLRYLISGAYKFDTFKKSLQCRKQNRSRSSCENSLPESFPRLNVVHDYSLMASTEITGLPLSNIIAKLDNFAPKSLAESWDNVGLLVEPRSKKIVNIILLTNDLTEDVMEEAVEMCADLIISYHPPIFVPMKSVTGKSWKERIIAACLENKIAVYSPHTSFDAINGGVNDWLASAFETKSVEPLIQNYGTSGGEKLYQVEISSPTAETSRTTSLLKQIQNEMELSSHGVGEELTGNIVASGADTKLLIPCSKSSLPTIARTFHKKVLETDKALFRVLKYEESPHTGIGMGRLCHLEKPLQVTSVIELIKKHIKIQHLRLALARYKNIDSSISTIALCAGSGASVLRNVQADLYLTGEMGHHDVLDAVHKGTHVILCEHSNTERGFLKVFANKLQTELLEGKVKVVISKLDADPLKIV